MLKYLLVLCLLSSPLLGAWTFATIPAANWLTKTTGTAGTADEKTVKVGALIDTTKTRLYIEITLGSGKLATAHCLFLAVATPADTVPAAKDAWLAADLLTFNIAATTAAGPAASADLRDNVVGATAAGTTAVAVGSVVVAAPAEAQSWVLAGTTAGSISSSTIDGTVTGSKVVKVEFERTTAAPEATADMIAPGATAAKIQFWLSDAACPTFTTTAQDVNVDAAASVGFGSLTAGAQAATTAVLGQITPVCTVTNCATCPTAVATCATCNSGFTLANNACTATVSACTPTNCKTCAVVATCTECNTGFTLASNACTATAGSNALITLISSIGLGLVALVLA